MIAYSIGFLHISVMQKLLLGTKDILSSINHWRFWSYLSWLDIKLRYDQSFLGPFWITANMLIIIVSMGFLYSQLFNISVSTYLPYLAAGLLIWNFISACITDSMDIFNQSKNFIMQTNMPFSTYIFRCIGRNIIIFLHNLLAILPVLLYFSGLPYFFSSTFAFILICLLMFGICGISAILGTRFNDLKQITSSILYLLFLATPILWDTSLLPNRYVMVSELNPIYHAINIMRAPLLGKSFPWSSVNAMLLLIIVTFLIYQYLLSRVSKRISFWI